MDSSLSNKTLSKMEIASMILDFDNWDETKTGVYVYDISTIYQFKIFIIENEQKDPKDIMKARCVLELVNIRNPQTTTVANDITVSDALKYASTQYRKKDLGLHKVRFENQIKCLLNNISEYVVLVLSPFNYLDTGEVDTSTINLFVRSKDIADIHKNPDQPVSYIDTIIKYLDEYNLSYTYDKFTNFTNKIGSRDYISVKFSIGSTTFNIFTDYCIPHYAQLFYKTIYGVDILCAAGATHLCISDCLDYIDSITDGSNDNYPFNSIVKYINLHPIPSKYVIMSWGYTGPRCHQFKQPLSDDCDCKNHIGEDDYRPCPVCEWGAKICKVCGKAEGELIDCPECPGSKV